ncbi:PAQR family membrane homeostasis protein TrhA [Geminicoccus roseus]|uniref:PAQR family membrane homeostasis protein TrhA n=1 Tax=Geminicoccus roseus TaxID=404900 RepID=UPI00040922EB|nr:hemolysin III family protein [Geminicoccus roseus]
MHLTGLALGALACIVLALAALPEAGLRQAAALGLYALGLMAMLACSARYHLASEPNRKHRLRRFDHAAIFLMIAGTYTPLLAIAVGSDSALFLLALVWLVALFGVAIKLLAVPVPEWLSVALYLGLGWTILLTPGGIAAALSGSCLALLVAGGIVYSLGVPFYLWRSLRFHTAIWHVFVLAGAACHYLVVLDEATG